MTTPESTPDDLAERQAIYEGRRRRIRRNATSMKPFVYRVPPSGPPDRQTEQPALISQLLDGAHYGRGPVDWGPHDFADRGVTHGFEHLVYPMEYEYGGLMLWACRPDEQDEAP